MGAEVVTKQAKASVLGECVAAMDTTGAGDALIGSFLHQLSLRKITVDTLCSLSAKELEEMLHFANHYAAISTKRHGAIASYPTLEELESSLFR